MEYRRIDPAQMGPLWELHKAYKAAIHENHPSDQNYGLLRDAIADEKILFYGAWDEDRLVGCCSVTVGFSTFNYRPSGVFEDFFIIPKYRHKGIARALVQFARQESSVGSLTVGCADCDVDMYKALGFSIPLGNLLAYD